jgi:hypothetical protein
VEVSINKGLAVARGGPVEGVAAVLAATFDPAQAPTPAAEQLALLPGGGEAEAAAQRAELVEQPSRGRPKGSKNRRTEEWARYVTSRYGSPLEALARVMHDGPAALARELGVSLVDGFDRWLRVTEALMPYVHGKQPTAVTLDNVAAAPVVLQVTPDAAARMTAAPAEAMGVLKIALDQALSEAGEGESNEEESNDAP